MENEGEIDPAAITTAIRRALDRDRAEAIVALLAGLPRDHALGTWPQRHADAMAAIRSADPEAMARAIIVLSGAARSFGERQLRAAIEELLLPELATVLHTTTDDLRVRANLG